MYRWVLQLSVELERDAELTHLIISAAFKLRKSADKVETFEYKKHIKGNFSAT